MATKTATKSTRPARFAHQTAAQWAWNPWNPKGIRRNDGAAEITAAKEAYTKKVQKEAGVKAAATRAKNKKAPAGLKVNAITISGTIVGLGKKSQ